MDRQSCRSTFPGLPEPRPFLTELDGWPIILGRSRGRIAAIRDQICYYRFQEDKNMKTILAILTYWAAGKAALPFWRPVRRGIMVFLWLPKLIAGALMPVWGLLGALGAVLGLARRDGKLAAAGIVAGGLAARFLADIPPSDDAFAAAFGADWTQRLPVHLRPSSQTPRWAQAAPAPKDVQLQRDVVVGHHGEGGRALLADLWQPAGARRSGLGLVYAHGSGWRAGDKDMLTRPFFRRLTSQGHVVLDVAYTLWPDAEIATMVSEINQAVAWLRDNGAAYGVDPERIVLMGGSAGGQLALTAAYAPGDPAFPTLDGEPSRPVHGVIAFYPAVDFVEIYQRTRESVETAQGPLDHAGLRMVDRLFTLQNLASGEKGRLETEPEADMGNVFLRMLGGEPEGAPESYRLLSPIEHVGPHCPPTLLLQGSDDVFLLEGAVRRLYGKLWAAGVPSVLVEFPHTEHGFDLVFPRVSPVTRAATRDVERFLALLA
jgi:acetyl esterase/lipase